LKPCPTNGPLKMLKIRSVRLEVNTSNGLYGRSFTFGEGLNIVRGNNSTGKSTLFQAILYGLGFEELLGGRNEKTMQSVLKDQVEYPAGHFHSVLQSYVYLEIEGSSIVTTRRSVHSEVRKPQLIDVFMGPLLTNPEVAPPSQPMYIHDKGGASDELYGFHVYLATLLNWQLPEVLTAKGDTHKLYLQQIAPAFILEQKSGWSELFATMPYYGMRNAETRVVEFLLGLDVFENQKRRQRVSIEKQNLTGRWQVLYQQMAKLAERSGGRLNGVDTHPTIINDFGLVNIYVATEEGEIRLKDLAEKTRQELVELEEQETQSVEQGLAQNSEALQKSNDRLNQLTLNQDMLASELSYDRERLKQFRRQLLAVQEDLRKNKGARKIKTLGAEIEMPTAQEHCPTCSQHVKDSLLPADIKQAPMRIDENIAFLEAQLRMIEVYNEAQQGVVREKEIRLHNYQTSLDEVRQRIRSLKRELVRDERMPSVVAIEDRLNLRKRVEFYDRVVEEFGTHLENLKDLVRAFEALSKTEKELSKDGLSPQDRTKLGNLQSTFIQLLRRFKYQSKPFDSIRIDSDTLLPVAQKLAGEDQYYNIKFDSSASDFIRCMWAYFTSLMLTSLRHAGNHPGLMILDEPKQQEMAFDSFRAFLSELATIDQAQTLVFASFENADSSFQEVTQGLKFNLVEIGDRLIQPDLTALSS